MFFSRDIFDPPTRFERIFTSPLHFLITGLYRLFASLRAAPSRPSSADRIRIVCISDTHTHTFPIPDGDVLIHAGDMTDKGTVVELQAQIDWLSSQPHTYKIAIAGNHDTYLDPRSRKTLSEAEQAEELDWKDVQYLQHGGTTLKFDNGRVLTVYGAPQIPKCGGSNFAFQYERGLDAWTGTLPKRVDILVTHTPPKYHMDLCSPWLGCEYLLREVWRVKPALHVFGHVHAGAGKEVVHWDDMQEIYEHSMAYRSGRGFLGQVISPLLWIDAFKVLVHGMISLLWDRIWAGDVRATTMINAALMVNNTGRLGNMPQVVEL
jgi:hypothetical protein